MIRNTNSPAAVARLRIRSNMASSHPFNRAHGHDGQCEPGEAETQVDQVKHFRLHNIRDAVSCALWA